jgi:hypothetical protein
MRGGYRQEAIPLARQAFKSSREAYGEEAPQTLEAGKELFRALAWPRGGLYPDDSEPEAILTLGRWIESRYMAQPKTTVDQIKEQSTGWIYVQIAMAQSALKMNDKKMATNCLMRAAALAEVVNLLPNHGLRDAQLEPLAQLLGKEQAIADIQKPGSELWGSVVNTPALVNFLRVQGADPIRWNTDPFNSRLLSPAGGGSLEVAVNEAIASLEKSLAISSMARRKP